MSCAIVLPVTAGVTPDDLKRSWGSFALQTYEPRILLMANIAGSPECLVTMAEIERFFVKAARQGIYCMQATLPREARSLYPLGGLVEASFLTVWKPGRAYHRDTLGHLSLHLGNGLSGVIYCERDPGVFGLTSDAWARLSGANFLTPDETLTMARQRDLWRKIPGVPDYTPPRVL